MDSKYELQLKDKGIRPTAMRMLVLKELDNAENALNLNELESFFDKVDHVTLYRTIKTFEEHHLIHSVFDGKDSVRYALCSSNCLHVSHVHFHCDQCERTICLERVPVPLVTLPDGYIGSRPNYVISGVCSECAHRKQKV